MKTPYIYHLDPHIQFIRDFISNEVCDHFVAIADSKLKRSKVMNNDGGAKFADSRTSQHCWVDLSEDDLIKGVAQSVSDLIDMPLENAENFQLVRYQVGQEYRAHYDTFDLDTVAGKHAYDRAGQRIFTAILYLNEVEQGGNTNFPNIGIEVEPNKGSLLTFENCIQGSTERHPKSLHGGMPVIKGEKWITNLWFREQAFK